MRVEHVSGHVASAMSGCHVRTIGIARARAKTGRENLACDIARFTFPMAAPAARASAGMKSFAGDGATLRDVFYQRRRAGVSIS